jgi:plastocyanin
LKITVVTLFLLLAAAGYAQHGHHGMRLDDAGMVMNENSDRLPRGCPEVSGDRELTVRAGTTYASRAPGQVFGLSQHEVKVEACERLHVTFVNEDQVRHQWMVHGLPKYLYPTGMFHLEANPGYTVSGTFIVPADDKTYLIHCDMAQHMEKGMKGQLVVGRGSGNLWSVRGVSAGFTRDDYLPDRWGWWLLAAVALGLVVATATVRFR